MWVPAVQSHWPLFCCATKTTYREGRRLLGLVPSSHHCWSDSLYLPLHGHVSSSSSKDTTNWFHTFCHGRANKQQPHFVNLPWSQASQQTLEQSLCYLLLRDFSCCPWPLPKVSVMKNPRDAETRSGKYQSGSKKSLSTFPEACRYTDLPQSQRPQHSMQRAWRHLVPAFLALPKVTSTAPQARESRTSNH